MGWHTLAAMYRDVPNIVATFRVRNPPTDRDTRVPCGPGDHRVAAIAYNSDKSRASVRGEDLMSVYLSAHAVGRYKKAAGFIALQGGQIVFAGDYLSTATVEGAIFAGQVAAESLRVA